MKHTDQVEIQQHKPDHHYRTEIPNIIFEIGLDPFQLSVYLHLKRITGEGGQCWRSIKTLSKTCGMGETKLKECLDFLSRKRCSNKNLISIIPRIKPDGSRDSNVIILNDIWKENGQFFRNTQSTEPIMKGGGSPGEGGVGRHTGGGGSPRDYKEQTLCSVLKETNKESVVCSLSKDEKEKREILKPYPIPPKLLLQFLTLSVSHLQDAVAAFEQFKASQEKLEAKLENPMGALRNAIIQAWKPNVTKADKQKEKEVKESELLDVMIRNKDYAKNLFEKWNHKFSKDFNFSISDLSVWLKYPGLHRFSLSFSDPAFAEIIEMYINKNLKS